MAFHHVAIATKDTKANHEFYENAMGFELVKIVALPNPESGWSKHFFYDTGDGELIAFWELHDPSIDPDFSPAIATGLGLPVWTNHIAFAATDVDDLGARRNRWLEHGHDVMEADHHWCRSVYTQDPNGILVEFSVNTREFDEADREDARARLWDPNPSFDEKAVIEFHRAQT